MKPLFAAFALAFATAAEAQMVAGRVTDRTSGAPVAGVVVSALDAGGAPLSRAVTDSVSGYRIVIGPGAAKLHFRRIGYSPATVPIADSANGRIDVVLTRLPTQLPAVKALATAQCNADSTTADALSLWDEARAGLLTSLVARDSRTAFMSVLVYETRFDGDDEQPRSVARRQMADVSHAFRSEDPQQLAKRGYDDGFSFVAPDESVLTDESFLATHCFRLGDATDSTVTLHFSPAKGRKVVEVEGDLRLRRAPLDLMSVEYRYVNIPANISRGRPGGSITFRNMPSGITMVQQWRVRSAMLVQKGARAAIGPSRVVIGRGGATRAVPPRAAYRDPSLEIAESGAIIELLQWPGAPAFMAPLATLSGVVIDKYSGRPLTNTAVRLYGTPFATTSDSTGAFSMIDVLPGVYHVDVGDPQLEFYGAAAELIGPISVKFGANTDLHFEGEGPEAAAIRGCSEKMEGRVDMPKQLSGKNAIFGVIAPEMRFQVEFRAEVVPAGAVAGTPGFPLKGKTDKLGRFRICGLPAGSVKLSARIESAYGANTVVVDPLHPYRLVTLKLAKPAGPQH